MYATGTNGIQVDLNLEYSYNYNQKEGMYIYGWQPRSVNIRGDYYE